jgi:hypothetical protein
MNSPLFPIFQVVVIASFLLSSPAVCGQSIPPFSKLLEQPQTLSHRKENPHIQLIGDSIILTNSYAILDTVLSRAVWKNSTEIASLDRYGNRLRHYQYTWNDNLHITSNQTRTFEDTLAITGIINDSLGVTAKGFFRVNFGLHIWDTISVISLPNLGLGEPYGIEEVIPTRDGGVVVMVLLSGQSRTSDMLIIKHNGDLIETWRYAYQSPYVKIISCLLEDSAENIWFAVGNTNIHIAPNTLTAFHNIYTLDRWGKLIQAYTSPVGETFWKVRTIFPQKNGFRYIVDTVRYHIGFSGPHPYRSHGVVWVDSTLKITKMRFVDRSNKNFPNSLFIPALTYNQSHHLVGGAGKQEFPPNGAVKITLIFLI